MALVKSAEISGAGSYPSARLRQRERKVLETAESYVAAVGADWASTDPATITAAIDRLAAAFHALLVKLDDDDGVTDTNYESTLTP